MLNLETSVAGIKLKNPITNASGILAKDVDSIKELISSGLGAVITKSITVEPRKPYNLPTAVPLECGMLNAVGLSNPGSESLKETLITLKEVGIPIIVSIAGKDEKEFAHVAHIAEKYGASAVELNLSCPHVERMGLEILNDISLTRKVVEGVTSTVKIPVIAKLGIVDDIVRLSGLVLESGAKALSLINTIRAMKIDVYTKKPVLSHAIGGLSGIAIHPIAVRVVYEVYKEYRVDIMGVGGVYDWETAIEMMLAGARAVQIGTAIIKRGLGVINEIIDGIIKYGEETGARSIEEIVGAAQKA